MELDRTVAEVAALVQGRVSGSPDRRLSALRAPDRAGADDLAVLFRGDPARAAADSSAGAFVVAERHLPDDPGGRTWIGVPDPEAALDTLTGTWGPRIPEPPEGVHPLAVVEPGAQVPASCSIGPWAWVGAGAVLGERCRLWPGVHVGAEARLGDDVRLYPHVFVGARCELGARVLVYPGAVIGADGFGFRQDASGRHVKSPQVGVVVLEDDVEVGAGCTIDRARLERTVIGAGTKLDAQVHVGHNCTFGRHNAIAGNCSFGGGATLGDHVMMGGVAGVDGSARVASGTLAGAYTFITRDTTGGGELVLGIPAQPHRAWKKMVAAQQRLPALVQSVRRLERDAGGDAS